MVGTVEEEVGTVVGSTMGLLEVASNKEVAVTVVDEVGREEGEVMAAGEEVAMRDAVVVEVEVGEEEVAGEADIGVWTIMSGKAMVVEGCSIEEEH